MPSNWIEKPKRKDRQIMGSDTAGGYTSGDYDEAIAATTQPQEANPNSGTTDYYDYLRNSSAADLLDAQVATELRNTVARKNLNTDLSRLGLANSGYAGTAGSMIANQYNAGMAQAQNSYNDAIAEINEKELLAQQEETAAVAENVNAYLQGIDAENYTTDEVSKRLENYGLTYNATTGKWENGSGSSYSDIQLREINNDYEDALKLMGLTSTTDSEGNTSYVSSYGSADELKSALNNGSANGKLGNDLDWEVAYLYDNAGRYSDGDVVKLINGSNSSINAYVKNVNGKWVIATEAEYNASSQKKILENGKEKEVGSTSAEQSSRKQALSEKDFETKYLEHYGLSAPQGIEDARKILSAYDEYIKTGKLPWEE